MIFVSTIAVASLSFVCCIPELEDLEEYAKMLDCDRDDFVQLNHRQILEHQYASRKGGSEHHAILQVEAT